MSGFTYEYENRQEHLEKYEWDNVWWEQTGVTDIPRVLYIGDSISCGTRRIATEVADGALLFDGFGTSKALDNPYLFDSISMFGAQQGRCDMIIFNNGLHGWHIEDNEEYSDLLERAIEFLQKRFNGTPIAIVLTTSVENEAREAKVKRRNIAATAVANKYGLPMIDLYSVAVQNASLRKADGVHFTPEGYTEFAKKIVSDVKDILGI